MQDAAILDTEEPVNTGAFFGEWRIQLSPCTIRQLAPSGVTTHFAASSKQGHVQLMTEFSAMAPAICVNTRIAIANAKSMLIISFYASW